MGPGVSVLIVSVLIEQGEWFYKWLLKSGVSSHTVTIPALRDLYGPRVAGCRTKASVGKYPKDRLLKFSRTDRFPLEDAARRVGIELGCELQ